MKKWILIIILVIVAGISYGVYVYNNTMSNKHLGEDKAIADAKKEASLSTITATDYYHGMSSYTIIEGTNSTGEQMIVWVPTSGGKVLSKQKKDGISQQQAAQIVTKDKQPKQIIKVKLGAENETPLWEITYIDQSNRYHYYYVNFTDGKFEGQYSI